MARVVFGDGEKLSKLIALSRAAWMRKPTVGQQVERLQRRRGITEDQAWDVLFGPDGQEAHIPGNDVPEGLWFVKDDGIYLMTNACLSPDHNPGVVYAAGYGPGPGTWERCRSAVGGDDFCEFIDTAGWDLPLLRVTIDVTAASLVITADGLAA